MDNDIQIKNLIKGFGDPELAIDNITLDIKKGEITGLIGPDGAEKLH